MLLRTKRAPQKHHTRPHRWGWEVLTSSCGPDEAFAFIQLENTLVYLGWVLSNSDLQGLTLGPHVAQFVGAAAAYFCL